MHKVCDIRNPDLRAGLAPRAMWAAYVADFNRLMDASGIGDPTKTVTLGGGADGRHGHAQERRVA